MTSEYLTKSARLQNDKKEIALLMTYIQFAETSGLINVMNSNSKMTHFRAKVNLKKRFTELVKEESKLSGTPFEDLESNIDNVINK